MKLLQQIATLEFPAPLPPTLLEVKQDFDAPRVADVASAAQKALKESGILNLIAPGETVAVGVGSRGIARLPVIVKAIIDCLKEANVHPFIIPAMGSHGATAPGQRAILAQLGITPESIGVEVRASMEVVKIGQIPNGPALFQDTLSTTADHTLLINRVKPHTDFRSQLESGLSKMAVIGLGKQRGATEMHSWGAAGFQRFLGPAARIYETNTNLVGGIAILENAYDETAKIVGLTAEKIGGLPEVQLQAQAKELMASLPFSEIDVLMIRQIGKNISGTGMDTNIVGRIMIPRQPENTSGPDVAVIGVLDITEESHGNAAGIGLANVTTARVAQKTDWTVTYTNAVTSGIFGMQRVSLPITMANDQHALQVLVRCCGQSPATARLVFIRDTLTLDRLWVSPNMHMEVEAHPRLSVVEETPLVFTSGGIMVSPWLLEP